MKKLFLLLSASAVLFSCSKVGKDEYIITGIAKGIDNGKTIILQTQDPNGMGGLINIDTVKVENGKFEIKGKVTEPSFHVLQLEAVNEKIPFILEQGEINIEVNKDSIAKSKISGTYNNDEYVKFNEEMKVVQKKLIDFQSANMLKMNQAQQAKDTAVINSLMQEYQKIQEEVGANSKTKYLSYAETHPKSFISALILQSMLQDPSADVKQAEKIYNSFDEELKNTKPGKDIKQRFSAVNSSVPGATAAPAAPANWRADFSAPNPEGKVISLKESLGKVTIVDFWASWCGPCRQENPNVVALYNELHSKGLNIIGVSLDQDAKKWKEAIAKDKLNWNQVSNLKGWQEPIATQYKVEAIPATFILDASGKVVARDLRGAELRAKIIELLAK